MSSSVSAPVKLTLSSNCLRNTTLENDDLKLHYRVETKDSIFSSSYITRLYRWDAKTEKEVLVAEWEKNWFKGDRYRIVRSSSSEGDFTPLKEILPNTWGCPCSAMFNRSFKGSDGRTLTWRARSCSLKLYHHEEHTEGKGNVVAEYHRAHFVINPHNAYIDLFTGYDATTGTLDMIVLTMLFCERRRRLHCHGY